MIKHELVTSLLRIGDGDPVDPYRKYSAVCTLVHEAPGVVWVKAMAGQLSRAQMRELLMWFSTQGVRVVKATRAPGHRLPGFVDVGDHLELDVLALNKRQAH